MMAMTKKELAEMASLRKELAIARAFTRTTKIDPDVMSPSYASSVPYSVGYLPSSYGAEKAWSTSVSHGYGEVKADHRSMAGRQNSRHLYSTPVLALKAMRWQKEEDFAVELAKIDAMIAAAEGGVK